MTSSVPVVHVVDDDASMRTAVERLLSAAGYTVRTYASAGDFLLHPVDGPGCILLDVRMPGPDGIALHEALLQRGDALPAIFITGHGDVATSVRAMKAGAVDFLTKPVEKDVLLGAVQLALERDREKRVAQGRCRAVRKLYETLSGREREVFALVVKGAPNKVIAGEAGMAERTVKKHRANLMEKLGVGTVADLVRLAQELDLRG